MTESQTEFKSWLVGNGLNANSSTCLELGATAAPQVNRQAVLDFPVQHARGSGQRAQGRIVSLALLALGIIE